MVAVYKQNFTDRVFFKDYTLLKNGEPTTITMRGGTVSLKGKCNKFNIAKESTYIYDTVVGRYFGIMKKYLHTARHSMQNSWGIPQTCFQNEIRCCV